MNSFSNQPNLLSAGLLREEALDESKYEEYRMNLDLELNRTERRERMTFHVCWVSLLVAWGLSLVGGLRVIGLFDPYDKTATALSLATGAAYVLACIVFPLSLAALYSQFRPRLLRIQQLIGDAEIGKLKRENEALRARFDKQVD